MLKGIRIDSSFVNGEMRDAKDGEIGGDYAPITDQSSVSPLLWHSYLMLSTFLDCRMHLGFHGIVAG